MYQLPNAAESWMRDRHGVATTRDLTIFGIRRSALERFERVGLLHRVERGVFVLAGSPATLAQRCAIQCCTHPRGFVTGPTCGAMDGLRRMPATASVHFAVRHGRHLPTVPGIHYRQTTQLNEGDRRRLPDGLVLASWPRLAFDLAADLRQLDHVSVVHQMLDRRHVTRDELRSISERLCHPARPGSTTFARTVEALGTGTHQSDAEVTVAELLRAAGVPIEAQVRITVPGRWPIHVDLGVVAIRWGVELDIHPEHRSVEGSAEDARRRSLAIEAGWTIETATELDVRPASLPTLVRRLAASYQRALGRDQSAV